MKSTEIWYDPVPFDHTYILYNPDDIISVLLVQFSLLPIYIMVFYTSWFLITREIEPVIVVGGHLLNEVLNKVIKFIVREPRPDFHKDFGVGSYSLTYGMPSAHSQFMGFFALYFILTLKYRIPKLTGIQKGFGMVILATAAALVAISRVYLLYHTYAQVLVGLSSGAVLGLTYFIITSLVRDIGLVDWILTWPIINYFWVKDSYYHSYQTFEDEYNFTMEERRAIKDKKLS